METLATTPAADDAVAMGIDSLIDYIKADFYSTPQETPAAFNCQSIKLAMEYDGHENHFVPVSMNALGQVEGYWTEDFIEAEHKAFKEIEFEWDDEDYWGLPFDEAVELLG